MSNHLRTVSNIIAALDTADRHDREPSLAPNGSWRIFCKPSNATVCAILHTNAPNYRLVLAAVEALKSYFVRDAQERNRRSGVKREYTVSFGPEPSEEEVPALIRAVCDWCLRHGKVLVNLAPLRELRRHVLCRLASSSPPSAPPLSGHIPSGFMPSWLLASPVPPSPALWTEAEWEQAIFKADDETLNVLKTWLRHAPELPWSGPAWEDETPQTRRLLIYMYGEDQVEVGDLVDAVWGKDTSEGAIQTAISKANNCLRREKYPRILTKVKAAAIIRWE